MRRLSLAGSVVAAAALAGSACGSDPTTPVTPTPPAIVETFTGTVGLNGAVTFPYVATQAGSTNATIKTLDPEAAITLGADGVGDFAVGETVYQGESLDTSTWRAVVQSWTPGARTVSIRGLSGQLSIGGVIKGNDSKAEWTASAIATTVVGLSLGTWSGTVCSIILTNDLAGVGGLIAGVVQGQGSLCARVYDVGKLSGPATFTIEVTHF
jgi:hypothetical protein